MMEKLKKKDGKKVQKKVQKLIQKLIVRGEGKEGRVENCHSNALRAAGKNTQK
jgi:hypothetical protein